MNHDVATWWHSTILRRVEIAQVGIGNMQRSMEAALEISTVDPIDSFRCPIVSFSLLIASWVSTKRNVVGLQKSVFLVQTQLPRFLFNYDSIGLGLIGK